MKAIIYLPQNIETPINSIVNQNIGIRYAYARSADTRSTNDPGQDFLGLSYDESSVVFAVCDGVSQSFFGDVAARFLGQSLIDWLQNMPANRHDPEEVREALSGFLHQITGEATKVVQGISLPNDLSPLFRDVLEQKRRLGSESTFICGRIDLPTQNRDGQILLAWMGDSRLRIWSGETEISEQLPGAFLTQQRWSTRQGPLHGDPHIYVASLERGQPPAIRKLSIYSDGFSLLDGFNEALPSVTVQKLIEQSWTMSASDDISFLEIWFGGFPEMIETLKLDPPSNIRTAVSNEQLQLVWERLKMPPSMQSSLLEEKIDLSNISTKM